jgi:uncharacterized membrane protein YgaE (UPF0421/DUF939 family)
VADRGPPPVFAAIAALLTVQPSINQSLGRGVERTVGVVAGVVVASVIGIVLGGGFGAIALSVVCALLLTWALRATPGTANQVAISAMLVLALGTASPDYAFDRIVETALGAVIGLVVNLAFVRRSRSTRRAPAWPLSDRTRRMPSTGWGTRS